MQSRLSEEKQFHQAIYANGGNKLTSKPRKLNSYHAFGIEQIAPIGKSSSHTPVNIFPTKTLTAPQLSPQNYGLKSQRKHSMAHSRFSPSGSKRWLACPASIQLAESIPFVMDTTRPAAQGTLVHHMVEMLLKDRLENVSLSDYWLGREEEIDGFNIEVTKDMVSCAEQYVEYVQTRLEELDGRLLIEEKVHIDEISQECWGTVDALVLGKKSNRIAVIDLKSGKFPVDVINNEQLMIYGLGALSRYGNESTTIELTIVQPTSFHRDGKIRSWDISAENLVEWGFNILKPAIEACLEEEPVFNAGKDQCRFCRAKDICDSFKQSEVM